MNDLTDRPSAWAIRRLELRVGEPHHQLPQHGRSPLNVIDDAYARRLVEWTLQPLEAANRLTQFVEVVHRFLL